MYHFHGTFMCFKSILNLESFGPRSMWMEKSDLHSLQNVSFCVPWKKESTYFDQVNYDNFHIQVNYPFKRR